MSALPVISGRKTARSYEEMGWRVVRQRGSHISIPDHKEVAKGTLRSLIRMAGITVDEFVSRL
jgi:predicted RNA binding protein YcfA (HicA-like mRNA interferase family)